MPDLFVNSDGKKPVAPKTITNESHLHALAQYCENPSFLTLQNKNITPTVKLFVRRHVITNVPWIVTTIVFLFIPLLVQILITITGTPLPPSLPTNFRVIFLIFYYLIALTYAFISFLDWFYNLIIITNTEIIDIDYADVIYHDVAATNVNLIEDVDYIQVGFIRGLFDYGDLFVQTAGGQENIEALAIPMPARITRIILDFIGKGEND